MAINYRQVVRGESWHLSFGRQYADDTTGIANVVKALPSGIVYAGWTGNCLGIFESSTLPDPAMDPVKYWAYGNASKRNYYIAYKNKLAFAGSIGDMTLLNGLPIHWAIGQIKTTGTDAGAGASTVNGATAVGATSVILADSTGYATGDFIQIGTGDNAECRYISNVAGNTLTIGVSAAVPTYPLSYIHAHGEVCNEVSTPYTHTCIESQTLDPIQIYSNFIDINAHDSLSRSYIGCKINKASLTGAEGDLIKFSFDDILCRTMRYFNYAYDSAPAPVSPFYSTDVRDQKPTMSYPITEPYYFTMGQLSLGGEEFARIRDFKLDISNNAEPLYYLNDDMAEARVAYEIREGRKEYGITAAVDIENAALFEELLRQGDYSAVYKGFTTTMVFTRGANDTITVSSPPSAPAAGGDSTGCLMKSAPHGISDKSLVSTQLDIQCRQMSVVIVDSIPVYP